MTPYYEQDGVTVHLGDCREVLATLEPESVQTVATSPPYFGLRSYLPDGHEDKAREIGLELTIDDYVSGMVDVFREVRRVLKDDGTVWLNLGDSYANDGKWGGSSGGKHVTALHGTTGVGRQKVSTGLKPKDLIGIPWRVAFALQSDGWYLRQDIIWAKPNPMPESVADRCTKSHEYIFLLSKSPRYFYDAAAIAESSSGGARGSDFHTGKTAEHQLGRSSTKPRQQRVRAEEIARSAGLTDAHIAAIRSAGITDSGKALVTQDGAGKNTGEVTRLADEAKRALGGYYREFLIPDKRNKRSVWTVSTQPFSDAHFATFPRKLIEPCIRAGSRPGDVVLDPFAGSGTTLEVAKHLGRRAIGVELNPDYLPMIARRLQQSVLNLEAVS